jgi:hypothetical protein
MFREDCESTSSPWAFGLWWGFPPMGAEKTVVAMKAQRLDARMDESGIHEGAKACVVAGFLATVRQWKRFEELWRPHSNPPFHAKHFFRRAPNGQRVGPYAGWSDARANGYFERLLHAIDVPKLMPLGSVLDVGAFRALSIEERHRLTGGEWGLHKVKLSGAPTKPYYLPFQDVIAWSLNESERRGDFHVYFTFDEQHQLEKHAINVYHRIKRASQLIAPDSARRMAGIAYESDEINIGLQAADLLCYVWGQFATIGEPMHADCHRAFQVLKQKRSGDTLHYFSREVMDKLLDKVPRTPGRVHEPRLGI